MRSAAAVAYADEQIVSALRRHDAEGIERLIDSYGGLIHHWAREQGQEAEDVVQDVLLRVWRSGDRLAPDTALPSFLKTVTRNASSNCTRTSVRRPAVPVGLEPADDDVDDPIGGETDRIAVEQALEHLAPRERDVLRLLYLADLPLPEVARRMNATAEATKSLAARARRRIRAELRQIA